MGWLSAIMFVVSLLYQQHQASKAKERQKRMQAEADKRADEAKGMKLVTESQTAPIAVIYGRNLIGGTRVFHRTSHEVSSTDVGAGGIVLENNGGNLGSGSKHEYLCVQQTIGFGPLSACYNALVDGNPLSSVQYGTGFRIHFYKGEGVSCPMAAGFDVSRQDATFNGISYMTYVAKLNRDEPQFSGVPDVQLFVEGLMIRSIEPTGPSSYQMTAGISYTNNPAYCLLDYLTNTQYGLAVPESSIDLKSFYDAAVVCDEVVNPAGIKGGLLWEGKGGVYTVKRYECNVALSSEAKIRENIEKILESMDMAELIWAEGKYKLQLNIPKQYGNGLTYPMGSLVQGFDTGGRRQIYRALATTSENVLNPLFWEPSAIDIDDDCIVRTNSEVDITWASAQSRLNHLVIKFRDESLDFEDNTVFWPDKTSTEYQNLLQEDSNVQLESEIYEDTVVDINHARNKAMHRVLNSRYSTLYTLRLNSEFIILEPGDIVRVNSEELHISWKLLRVNSVQMEEDTTVKVELQEFDESLVRWYDGVAPTLVVVPTVNTAIGQASNLQFDLDSSNVYAVGRLSWSPSDDVRVIEYVVKYTTTPISLLNEGTEWTDIGVTQQLFMDIPAVVGGTYVLAVVPRTRSGKLAEKYSQFGSDQWATISIGLPSVEINGTRYYGISIFRRSILPPSTPTGGTFDFQTLSLSSLPSGWSATVPTGTSTLYTSRASISSSDTNLVWSTPYPEIENTLSIYADKDVIPVLKNDYGVNFGYQGAVSRLKVLSSGVDITFNNDTEYNIISVKGVAVIVNNVDGHVDKGLITVTNLDGDLGTFVIRVSSGGVFQDRNMTVGAIDVGYVVDTSVPPVPPPLQVLTGIGAIFISVPARPIYTEGHGHSHIEIIRSTETVPEIWNASPVGRMSDTSLTILAPTNTASKVWARNVSKDGVASPWSEGYNANTGFITGADISPLIMESMALADGSVTTAKLAADAVTSAKIAAGAIGSTQISDGAISSDKIAANAIVADKIAADAITANKIVAGAINAEKLAAGAIAVGTAAIANGAIVNAMIGDAVITGAKIADASITSAKIESLDAAKINAGTLGAEVIFAGTISADRIASGTLSSGVIYSGAVSATQITSGLIKSSDNLFRVDLDNKEIYIA